MGGTFEPDDEIVQQQADGGRVRLIRFLPQRHRFIAAGYFDEDVVDFGHEHLLDENEMVEQIGRQTVLERSDLGLGAEVVAPAQHHSVDKLLRFGAVLLVRAMIMMISSG